MSIIAASVVLGQESVTILTTQHIWPRLIGAQARFSRDLQRSEVFALQQLLHIVVRWTAVPEKIAVIASRCLLLVEQTSKQQHHRLSISWCRQQITSGEIERENSFIITTTSHPRATAQLVRVSTQSRIRRWQVTGQHALQIYKFSIYFYYCMVMNKVVYINSIICAGAAQSWVTLSLNDPARPTQNLSSPLYLCAPLRFRVVLLLHLWWAFHYHMRPFHLRRPHGRGGGVRRWSTPALNLRDRNREQLIRCATHPLNGRLNDAEKWYNGDDVIRLHSVVHSSSARLRNVTHIVCRLPVNSEFTIITTTAFAFSIAEM